MPLPEPMPVDGPLLPGPEQQSRQPVWLIVMGIYVLLGMLGILVATRRLRVMEPRSRAVPVVLPPTGESTPGAPAPAAAQGWEQA